MARIDLMIDDLVAESASIATTLDGLDALQGATSDALLTTKVQQYADQVAATLAALKALKETGYPDRSPADIAVSKDRLAKLQARAAAVAAAIARISAENDPVVGTITVTPV